jgi:hypothetical protein
MRCDWWGGVVAQKWIIPMPVKIHGRLVNLLGALT